MPVVLLFGRVNESCIPVFSLVYMEDYAVMGDVVKMRGP